MHTSIHTDVQTFIHLYIHTFIHLYIHTFIHSFISLHDMTLHYITQTHTHIHTHIYYIYIYIIYNIYTHIDIHATRTYIYIYTHVHICVWSTSTFVSWFGWHPRPGSSRKGRDCLSQLVMSTQTEDLETEDVGSQCVTPALLPVAVQTSYASDSRWKDDVCDKSILVIRCHQMSSVLWLFQARAKKLAVCHIPKNHGPIIGPWYSFGSLWWLMLIPSDSIECWLLTLCKLRFYAPFLLAPVFSKLDARPSFRYLDDPWNSCSVAMD